MQVCTKNAIILVSVLSEALDYQIVPALQSVLWGLSGTHSDRGEDSRAPLNAGNKELMLKRLQSWGWGDGGSDALWFPVSLSISESLAFVQQVCSRCAGSTGVLVLPSSLWFGGCDCCLQLIYSLSRNVLGWFLTYLGKITLFDSKYASRHFWIWSSNALLFWKVSRSPICWKKMLTKLY